MDAKIKRAAAAEKEQRTCKKALKIAKINMESTKLAYDQLKKDVASGKSSASKEQVSASKKRKKLAKKEYESILATSLDNILKDQALIDSTRAEAAQRDAENIAAAAQNKAEDEEDAANEFARDLEDIAAEQEEIRQGIAQEEEDEEDEEEDEDEDEEEEEEEDEEDEEAEEDDDLTSDSGLSSSSSGSSSSDEDEAMPDAYPAREQAVRSSVAPKKPTRPRPNDTDQESESTKKQKKNVSGKANVKTASRRRHASEKAVTSAAVSKTECPTCYLDKHTKLHWKCVTCKKAFCALECKNKHDAKCKAKC